MKFSITHKHIQEVLTKFGRVLSNRISLPILAGVLVQATEQFILFTASDSSDSVVVRLMVDEKDGVIVTEAGSTVLHKDIFDTSKRLKGAINFELNDQKTYVKISQNKTVLDFAVMNAEEYPAISSDDQNIGQYKMSGNEFGEIVRKTSFAALKSEIRPVLQAVQMTFSNTGSRYVCTDSHRLATYSKAELEQENSISLNVPAKALDQAIKSFDLTKEVFISASKNQIAFANGNTIMHSRLIEGNYPDTSSLIPSEFISNLIVNRQELIDALELLQVLTVNSSIKLTIGNLFVSLDARSEVSKGNREIAFESYDGEEDFTIAFSAQLVLDALKTYDASSVCLAFTGSLRPFVITEVTENKSDVSSLQLILPVRSY